MMSPSRRRMLSNLGSGMGMVGLAGVMAEAGMAGAPAPVGGDPVAPRAPHFAPRARHVIHLFMNGGPSQVDTFDPKPELLRQAGKPMPAGHLATERKTGNCFPSAFKFHKSGRSGVEVSEIFPEVARQIDDICVIRSMHTNVPNHEPSLLMMTSGNLQPIRPSMGSWLSYGLGSENRNLPGFVVLCPGKPTVGPQLWGSSFLPGAHQGCHIQTLDPRRMIENIRNDRLGGPSQRRQLDLINAMNRQHLSERGGDDQLEARILSFEMAFRMQAEASEAFDVSREPASTRARYGTGAYADSLIVARRLVERGVRTVQVFTGSGQPWDDHGDLVKGHRSKGQTTDRPIAALLADLKGLGLLDETLVLWGGEFGRTPTSEGADGRDHNNHGFTVWLAGGGVRGGMVHGATDDFGFAAVSDKVHVHDLHATILHLMGFDHERLTYRYSGRDFRLTDVHGTVVRDILA